MNKIFKNLAKNAFVGVVVLSLLSFANANAQATASDAAACQDSMRHLVSKGKLEPGNAQGWYNNCINKLGGTTATTPAQAPAHIPARAPSSDPYARCEAIRPEVVSTEGMSRQEARMHTQVLRAQMRPYKDCLKAVGEIITVQIEASAPAECKDDVSIDERQQNINWGPAFGHLIRGDTNRIADALADEAEDVFKDQSRRRKTKCKDTYYSTNMPNVDHEKGQYTGILKGILNNL